MEVKKNKEIDMNDTRYTYILNGILFAAGLSLASFSYKTVVAGEGIEVAEEVKMETKTEEVVKKKDEPKPVEEIKAVSAVVVPQINVAAAITEDSKTVDNTGKVNDNITIGEQSGNQSGDNIIPVDPPKGDITIVEEPIVEIAEVDPEFSGGSVNAWLSRNLVYPQMSIENNEEGTALVGFVVEKDGKLSNVKIFRSSGSDDLDQEAIQTVRRMPAWKAGENGGKPVRSKFQVKVAFKLN
jgi:periplasmic protein TonB